MVALTQKLNLMALRLHLGLFIFNPYRVVGWLEFFPRFHLGLFIFNPYGVEALPGTSPGSTL